MSFVLINVVMGVLKVRVFYSHVDEIIDDLDRIINYTKENYSGRVFLIGHSMGGYAVTLFGTKYLIK